MSPKRSRSPVDPFTVRSRAIHDKENYTSYIEHKQKKVARLEQREDDESIRRLERARDQVENLQTKLQRAEDKIQEMTAIINSGDIDSDVDYSRLSDLENPGEQRSSSESASSENIVTDYDISDLEGECEDDDAPAYDDNSETPSYSTSNSRGSNDE